MPAGLAQAGVLLAAVTGRIGSLTDRLSGAERSVLTGLIETMLGPEAVAGAERGS